MNSDIDNTRNALLWLLRRFDPTFSIPSGHGSTAKVACLEASAFGVGSDATSSKPTYQQGKLIEQGVSSSQLYEHPSTFQRIVSFSAFNPHLSTASREHPSQTAQSFNFGEIHAVQDRFHDLLKERLLLEYQNKPPLFPWESEVADYPHEVSELSAVSVDSAPSIPLTWQPHVKALKVPNLLPQPVLNALFQRCQAVARESSRQGVRLVRAVEGLFPAQGDMLEPIANVVLMPAYRSHSDTQAAVTQELVNVAGDYEAAKPEQQIALSMLAAQEILDALMISLLPDHSPKALRWMTPNGWLEVTADYRTQAAQGGALSVEVILPEAAKVSLTQGSSAQSQDLETPGKVRLAWPNAVGGQSYSLAVEFSGKASVEPLSFSIHLGE